MKERRLRSVAEYNSVEGFEEAEGKDCAPGLEEEMLARCFGIGNYYEAIGHKTGSRRDLGEEWSFFARSAGNRLPLGC